ncbi:hypothetical protein HK097_011255 [Rhizophlyctis rosea]|uniref:Uncharacterized protein n=1 Tax=Rhizophlyctis rosea TaxID=64517 RepID=A0AAD5S6N6_9FUNG|nr:hypothetical protein HK097_011255 [Rhizophlyctis rosea]
MKFTTLLLTLASLSLVAAQSPTLDAPVDETFAPDPVEATHDPAAETGAPQSNTTVINPISPVPPLTNNTNTNQTIATTLLSTTTTVAPLTTISRTSATASPTAAAGGSGANALKVGAGLFAGVVVAAGWML